MPTFLTLLHPVVECKNAVSSKATSEILHFWIITVQLLWSVTWLVFNPVREFESRLDSNNGCVSNPSEITVARQQVNHHVFLIRANSVTALFWKKSIWSIAIFNSYSHVSLDLSTIRTEWAESIFWTRALQNIVWPHITPLYLSV